MKFFSIIVSVLIGSCVARPVAMTVTPVQTVAVHAVVPFSDGDPAEGRKLFTKLRCDICHSVGNGGRGPHPLPDLSAQPPEAVAALITQRKEIAPGALFDEMAMSAAASRMTPQELSHIVAYLRNPSARP